MAESSAEPGLRALPSADRVLRSPPITKLAETFQRQSLVRLIRRVLADYREAVRNGAAPPSLDSVTRDVNASVRSEWVIRPRPVLNATGVILHTNLGRAPLSQAAIDAAAAAAAYSDLEYDLESGERGSRQAHPSSMLLSLLDAEASHVAVNSAAALLLALTALARGKEVILSRGQSVEIGGGFRVPVIMRQSGAKLVEVGTTNRTRLADYEDAISDRTAAILHVHSSNFRIVGFTENVALADLAKLAHRYRLPLIDDNGSGSLIDTRLFGLGHEPMPQESLKAGADLVVFSGDKLLGGPQAGIMVGRADLIKRISSHPLARALRPDKSVIAALSATLLAYLQGRAANTVPVWRMISISPDTLAARAARWVEAAYECGIDAATQNGESTIGGGSLPGETLPTTLIRLPAPATAARLRAASPPVIGRTQGSHVLIDLRTIP
ncbi:MAG: L-seryl-tRNA(Sec) selenium transferase [Chloroflexota bacterium]